MKEKGHIGSLFDNFLQEGGILDECEEHAIKEIIAMQIVATMKTENISKAEMARRMNTSRPALERLLDTQNSSVTLHTLQKAAMAVGKRIRIELVEAS